MPPPRSSPVAIGRVDSSPRHERAASLPLYYTDDYREGVDAFGEDREPEWRGS